MKNEKMPLIPLLLFIVLLFNVGYVVTAILYDNIHIASIGTIKTVNVEAYWDFSATNVVTEIDWDTIAPDGYVEPGTEVSTTIYIKSLSNADVTLMMYTGSYLPLGIDAYISCTWDADGLILSPDMTLVVRITLSIEQGIIEAGYETFSFDILIEGSG